MFTGLVEAIGVVRAARPGASGVRLVVDPGAWNHRPEIGESIAVSGCCLTIAAESDASGGAMVFDVVPETLTKTTLGGRIGVGSRVNLEHAATATTLMGGHFVQGHVDGVGTVERVDREEGWRVRVRPPSDLMPYVTPKGSVTIEGVSLTVAAVDPAAGWFEVALIPTTLDKTTLGDLKPGDGCNLEADVLAKTVVHYLRHYAGGGPGAFTARS
jgi:riboflavin synthase